MYLEIVTPEKVVFKEEIDELIVPTVNGEIAILPNHVNLLTQIDAGEMIIKVKKKEQVLAITGGFLQIQNNNITVLSDFAIRSEEIDAKQALEAQKRAEEMLKKNKEDMSERDFAQVQADMRKAILELKVARKRHRSGPPTQ